MTWSGRVMSGSSLGRVGSGLGRVGAGQVGSGLGRVWVGAGSGLGRVWEIGRASCRERV